MTGSEKQVTWALSIQAVYIRDVRAQQQANTEAARRKGQLEQWNTIMDDVVAQAEAKQDAVWWIDNRQHTSVGGRGQIFRAMYTTALAKVST